LVTKSILQRPGSFVEDLATHTPDQESEKLKEDPGGRERFKN